MVYHPLKVQNASAKIYQRLISLWQTNKKNFALPHKSDTTLLFIPEHYCTIHQNVLNDVRMRCATMARQPAPAKTTSCSRLQTCRKFAAPKMSALTAVCHQSGGAQTAQVSFQQSNRNPHIIPNILHNIETGERSMHQLAVCTYAAAAAVANIYSLVGKRFC